MDHDEAGRRPVGQWLRLPFLAGPQFTGFEKDAERAVMPLEDAGLGGSSRHSDLAHHGVQEVGSIGWLAEDSVVGFDDSIGHGTT